LVDWIRTLGLWLGGERPRRVGLRRLDVDEDGKTEETDIVLQMCKKIEH